jgi:hypothetical protein
MSKLKKKTIKVLVNDKVDNTAYIKSLENIVDVVTIPLIIWMVIL